MQSEFKDLDTGTPSSTKRRRLGSAAETSPNLLDFNSTQEHLYNAGVVPNPEDQLDPFKIFTTDIPVTTLAALIQSMNAVSDTVLELKNTVISLEKKIKCSRKETKGLKRVIKDLYIHNKKAKTDIPTEVIAMPEAPRHKPPVTFPPAQTATTAHRATRMTNPLPTQPVTDNSNTEIWQLKKRVFPLWGKKYFYRTKEWGRGFINNYRANTLHDQAVSDPPYIPPKYRKYHARDEAHYKILEKMSINQMHSTVDEYVLNGRGAKQNVIDTDTDVTDQIKRHGNPVEKDKLLSLWEQETKAGEAHSIQRARSSQQWLRDLPAEKPYHGFSSCRPEMRAQRGPNNGSSGNVTGYRTENPVANDAHPQGGFRQHRGNLRMQRNGQSGGGGGAQWRRQGRQNFW